MRLKLEAPGASLRVSGGDWSLERYQSVLLDGQTPAQIVDRFDLKPGNCASWVARAASESPREEIRGLRAEVAEAIAVTLRAAALVVEEARLAKLPAPEHEAGGLAPEQCALFQEIRAAETSLRSLYRNLRDAKEAETLMQGDCGSGRIRGEISALEQWLVGAKKKLPKWLR